MIKPNKTSGLRRIMSNRAPNNAPKTAPKIKSASNNTPPEWKEHWLARYHEPRIVWYRQKYAIAVTKPSELRKPTDPDKKLSARTTDKKIAEERKWEIAATIYTGFDEALKDVDPQLARSATFRRKAIQLLARNGIRHPSIAKAFTSDWFELDDLVRLINRFEIDIPDEMLELIDDEAKYFITHLPTLVEKTEVDEAAELLWGTKEFDTDKALKDIQSITTKLLDTADAENADILTLALQSLSLELEKHNPSAFSDRDRELSSQIKTNQSTQTSSKIKEVRQRYLSENRWNRNRTKTGAALAIQRFCDLHGGDEDIANFNAKHAYEFAQWMDQELNSANKSIKAALSYVKGMFTWAITQKQYSITEEPWGTLHRIGTYGKEEESYKPFERQQLLQLFQLTNRTSSGRMNPREHLLLSILITTGCRLDEAALLCWDNIIRHEAGWYYIDLTKSLVRIRVQCACYLYLIAYGPYSQRGISN